MNSHRLRSIAVLCLPLLLCTSATADVRDDYELTVQAAVKADRGWQLYKDARFSGAFQDGHYTDPDVATRVKDFWSNGRTAKLDRDGNGHFETILLIADKELVYAGSIGREGKFIHTAIAHQRYIGRPVQNFVARHKK